MSQASAPAWRDRLGLIALLAVAAPLAVLVIVAPLDLTGQWLFAAGVIAPLMLMLRRPSRRTTVIICVVSVMVSTRYIFWRATQTLEFDHFSGLLLGGGLFLAELFAWFIHLLGIFQTVWPLRRPPVALEGDDRDLPTVDVYIPTYNESLSVVRTTVFAAMAMDYPPDKLRVYLLDDGRRPEFRRFAQSAGCGYLTRGDNLHAKAGNLNAALPRTRGELICIFDCDHVATRAFLQMTAGWFQRDPRLALLQTPHHFYSLDPVQRNLPHGESLPGEGELFYDVVQDGNDLWNATFFCGSCAIIRRSSLEEVGGFAGETVTEDAHTALKLQRRGWRSAYINIRLSAGLATERLALHIGQRARWARGMTQLLRLDNPLTGRGLSLSQRLCYLNAMLHFQFPLPRIVFLTSPLAYLLAGQNVIHAPAALIFAYALPHLFGALIVTNRLQSHRRGLFWSEIYETLLAFHLLRPTLETLIDPRRGKFNVTAKGGTIEKGYFDYRSVLPHIITAGLLVVGVFVGVGRLIWGSAEVGTLVLNTAWSIFSLLLLSAAIMVARETQQLRNDVRVKARIPVTVYFDDGRTIEAMTEDASTGGLSIRLPPGLRVNETGVTDVDIHTGGAELILPVRTIAVDDGVARLSFETLTLHQQRRLGVAIMGRSDAWQTADQRSNLSAGAAA
ncbi:UDP-forming cellulose synthase catalytic subunit [Brevundimonas naejangsanensis]|uniref:UDP-forming cellulose synthase catalytic subunit n=1 Tax=Brevundimonas naejangsanensis TaxID=588932 RepID=UPI0026F23A6D|nr:UDP-forming cellulose synthase catalytic subunit [Brevundimonas naejangsanensis]